MKTTSAMIPIVALLVSAGSAGAVEPTPADAARGLRHIATRVLPCSHLTVTYEATDVTGGATRAEIAQGRVTFSRTRIGLAEDVRRGALDEASCRQIVDVVVASSLWLMKQPPNRGLAQTDARIWVGVKDRGSFSRSVPVHRIDKHPPFASVARALLAVAERATSPAVSVVPAQPEPANR